MNLKSQCQENPKEKIISMGSKLHYLTILCCEFLEYPYSNIKKYQNSRLTVHKEARQIISYILRLFLNNGGEYFNKNYSFSYSFEDIGKCIGKDHSTIVHSIQTVKNLMSTEAIFKEYMYELISFIKTNMHNHFQLINIIFENDNIAISQLNKHIYVFNKNSNTIYQIEVEDLKSLLKSNVLLKILSYDNNNVNENKS
jgi:hypothetical protein